MAEEEHQLGVRSTYFVMTRSQTYNLLSLENTKAVLRILELGHAIGLHFDCEAMGDARTIEETAAAVDFECILLEKWFGVPVKVVSFHKPDALVLGGDPNLSAPRRHTYQRAFMREMTYLADSYGFWRYGHPLKHPSFEKKTPLHICAHPIWWNDETWSPLYSLKQLEVRRKEVLRRNIL
jgi:hypothetical protein